MQVERHFREIREACGLKAAQVCEVIDKSEGYLSKLETGKSVIKVPILPRLARLYQCHPFDFLTFHHFPLPRMVRTAVCGACGARLEEDAP